jgi:FKBP-type peptidyl-prolyl cis-trans isomerase SlyD
MQIAQDMFVVIEYRLQAADGLWIKGQEQPESMNFIAGYDQVLPGLEARLRGLEEGAEVSFVVPCAEAFGPHDPHLLQTRGFEEFPEGRRLIPGKWVSASHEPTQARYVYRVLEKTQQAVVLDFNHPLAGQDLHYQVRVVRVRPALQDELEFLRPCAHTKGDDGPGGPFPQETPPSSTA